MRDVYQLYRDARELLRRAHGWQSHPVTISHRLRVLGGNLAHVTQPVRTVHVPCHFGGSRPPFFCPGTPYRCACSRHSVAFYCHFDLYLYRHCQQFAYTTDRSGELDRVMIADGMIEQRLGGDPDILVRFPCNPNRGRALVHAGGRLMTRWSIYLAIEASTGHRVISASPLSEAKQNCST